MATVQLDSEELRPLIERVVAETIARVEADRGLIDGKLGFSEPEAARLLGLEPHQLRDERLRGRIAAYRIVGDRIRYTREDLVRYLLARPWETGRNRDRVSLPQKG